MTCVHPPPAEPGSAGLAAPQVTNPPPYCAELFSPRQLPYGFHAASLARYGAGFPLLFDINLDAGAALRWLDFVQVWRAGVVVGRGFRFLPGSGSGATPTFACAAASWLPAVPPLPAVLHPWAYQPIHPALFPPRPPPQEGLYLDSRTSRLLAQLVAYNPDLRLFSSALVELSFGRGGAVQVGGGLQGVAAACGWQCLERGLGRQQHPQACPRSSDRAAVPYRPPAHRSTRLPLRSPPPSHPAPPAPPQVSSRIQTLRVELYATRLDAFRLVLELALSLCVAVMALGELRTMARVRRGRGGGAGDWGVAGPARQRGHAAARSLPPP